MAEGERQWHRGSCEPFAFVGTATAAIPGTFPPVVIDIRVHSDGGIMAGVLPVLDYESSIALAARRRRHGITQPVTVRLWVLMSVVTHAPIKVINPANRGDVHAAENGLLFHAQQPRLLSGVANLPRAVTADVPGLRIEMRYASIPATFANAPGADKLFDSSFMRRLDQRGFERAQSAAAWDGTVSANARPGIDTFSLRR